jgi:chromatin assembly factor 1 subunit A
MRKESTNLLSCRNPFRVDPDMINYELDSEEEWAEQNGEDLNEDQNADDEEEGESEQDEHAGFIVEDDYLSASELNYSQCSDREMSQELLHADLKRRR